MTNEQLWSEAWKELSLTTDSYPTWKKKGFPSSSHWAKAKALGDQIGTVTPPPPAGGLVIAVPVEPLATVPPIYLPTNLPGTTEKQHVTSSSTDGLRLMKWPPAKSTGRYTLRDLRVDHVAASPPRSADGTKESGFWIGQTADAYRLVAEDCAWMGLWTGCMVDGSDIHDFELLRQPHVGIYCEHITRNTRFHNFRVEIIDNPAKEAAVKCEWWYRNTTYGPMLPYGGLSGTYSNVFEDFEIIIPPGVWAFRLEPGTFDTTIRNGKIIYSDPGGPGNLGISHPTILVDPSRPNKIDWPSIEFVGSVAAKEHKNTNPIGA